MNYAEVSYLPSVAALVSYSVLPVEIYEKPSGEIEFKFERTPRFHSLLTRSMQGSLHVRQGTYDAAICVLRQMVRGEVPLDVAELAAVSCVAQEATNAGHTNSRSTAVPKRSPAS